MSKQPYLPGFYWAKLVTPTRMPEGEDWASTHWEVVEVLVNGGDRHSVTYLGVLVPGVQPTQWIADFEWHQPVRALPPPVEWPATREVE